MKQVGKVIKTLVRLFSDQKSRTLQNLQWPVTKGLAEQMLSCRPTRLLDMGMQYVESPN